MHPLADIPAFKAMLIDDHLMFSQGLSEIIKNIAPDSYVTNFNNVHRAKLELKMNEYNFILSDLLIPGNNVKEFISECRRDYPDIIIIIISSVMDISVVKEYFALGVNGYLSKAVNFYELKIAMEKTYQGDRYVSSDLSGRLASSYFMAEKSALTKKELEILRLVAAGHSVDKAAQLMHVSPYTVLAHRRNIMKKLDAHSAAELVKYAFENNLY